ncbi:hypothetical protein HPULCUR_001502 [Helicostylum pulchrum]|uniref:Uncharacterized protein n=1 Tax=Helicostylum pulchrum TaxID=562976 RepID=A0ABP9XPP1_9FUNG
MNFGAISCGLSIAHVDKPRSKFTVNTWLYTPRFNRISSGPEQFLTSILYKANKEIHGGFSRNETEEGDVYIDNIKQYILNIDQANEELEQKLKGLTIQKAVTDYLKSFHALAIERLKKQKDFCNSYNFEQDFKLENLSYCLSCPASLNDFFANCFVEAGITEKDNLIFVSEAEATAFHCLSIDRRTTKIAPDQTYFVCDVGHSSFGVSKIKADSTENFSEVELISEELEKGSMVLENSFIDYLNENKSELNLNESIISSLVETFVKEIKFSFEFSQENYGEGGHGEDFSEEDYDEEDFGEEDSYEEDFDYENFDEDNKHNKSLVFKLREDSTEVGQEQEEEIISLFNITNVNGDPIEITIDDLEKHVFSSYIDYLINYIMKVHQENNGESNFFLCGKYSSDANFYEKLCTQNNGTFEQFISIIEDTNVDAVSLGAVSFGLKIKNVQIPFFHGANSNLTSSEPQKNVGSSEKLKTEHKSKEFDFIVGIDFGTTFTGCSYADPNDAQVNGLKAIHTIETGWPGGNAIMSGKTPTLLMYDKNMKTKLWGQEAKQNVDRYKDLSLLRNFKPLLHLEAVEAQYGVGNHEIARIQEANKHIFNPVSGTSQGRYKLKKESALKRIGPIQVCADYLKEVKKHVIRHIVAETKFKKGKKGYSLFSKSSENEPKIQFVLTVPDIWNESERESMAQIAIKATVIKEDELDDLLIISELEAETLFCEKKYSYLFRDPENPYSDSNFIICDAGAQTVGLLTFRLTRNQEDGDPMISQIGNGIGDNCGSAYIDRAFKEYLLKFYRDIGLEVKDTDTSFDFVMDDFAFNIKYNFKPGSTDASFCTIKLPAERIITNIPNTKETKQYNLIERNTKLKIKHADIKEKFFDPIITKILLLIKQQLDQASRSNTKIKAIMLVGGFSRNPYLQQCIQDELRGNCDVITPEEGAAAISKGAVSYGLKPSLISKKIASQSIALEVRTPFEKSKGDRFDREVYKDYFDDEVYSKNRLEYFVSQSDDLQGESLKLFHRTVTIDYPNNAVIAVFACDFKEEDDKENWRYVSKRHTKILEEIIKLPEVEEINGGDPVHFNVSIQMDRIGATIIIECKNRFINRMNRDMTNGNETSLKVVRKCELNVVKIKRPLAEYSLARYPFALR